MTEDAQKKQKWKVSVLTRTNIEVVASDAEAAKNIVRGLIDLQPGIEVIQIVAKRDWVEEARALLDAGDTYAEVAHFLDIDRRTLRRTLPGYKGS